MANHFALCRSLEPGRPKRLYFVSSGVKHLLQNDDREALKVTMTGLKVFERQELKVSAVVTSTAHMQQVSLAACCLCALDTHMQSAHADCWLLPN